MWGEFDPVYIVIPIAVVFILVAAIIRYRMMRGSTFYGTTHMQRILHEQNQRQQAPVINIQVTSPSNPAYSQPVQPTQPVPSAPFIGSSTNL